MDDVKQEVEQISRTPSPGDDATSDDDDASVEVGLRTWYVPVRDSIRISEII